MGISPQTLSSLSFFFDQTDDMQTFYKLQTIFAQLGAKAVFDLSCFNAASLYQSYFEFKERFVNSAKSDPAQIKAVKKSSKWNSNIGHLPILSSECPGWVCYAEKTIGEEAFPFMSKVKSGQ